MLAGSYSDWTALEYRPVVAAHHPDLLLRELPPGAAVLDVGCHDGLTACHIASVRTDARVHGVDINPAAIDAARERAAAQRLANVTFAVADVLTVAPAARYDGVVTIRVLTCFPSNREWLALLRAVRQILRPGGWWYAVDYLYDPDNDAYTKRYAAGERQGWRRGNFRVDSASGEPLFIAHHHTTEDLECLKSMFGHVRLRRFESLSMHGNRAAMFELLATTQGAP